MFTKYTTAILALVSLASAVPAATKETIVLAHDDVVLPRADGGFDIMKDWEWDSIERRLEREAREAEATEAKRRALAGETIPLDAYLPGSVVARDCEESREMQVLIDTTFTDWDVAMSPVVGATGGSATIMVAKGYSVANSISVSVGADYTYIPDVLEFSMEITTSATWTSTDTQTFSFAITQGQYGVVVSNPLTRRVAGNYLYGCTDSPTVGTFSSDSRTSQTFGDLSWVAGPIKLCNSTTYPVPYCVGTGSHS